MLFVSVSFYGIILLMAIQESGNFNKPPIRNWSANHNPRKIQGFLRKGEITQAEAIKRFECSGRLGIYMAAQLSTEQAYSSPNFETASFWLNKASENYHKLLIQNKDIPTSRNLQLAGIVGRAQLPLHTYFACFGELPPMPLLAKSYADTVGAIQGLVTEFRNGEVPAKNKSDFLGNLTEATVLLLAQRYTLRELGESSWVALGALYSQDHANNRKDRVRSAWDMTVFTDLGDGPTGSYFVQIKSTNGAYAERDYAFAEGITPLYFFPNMFLPNESGLPQIGIISQLQRELDGDSSVSNVLDLRTAKMLDVLG